MPGFFIFRLHCRVEFNSENGRLGQVWTAVICCFVHEFLVITSGFLLLFRGLTKCNFLVMPLAWHNSAP